MRQRFIRRLVVAATGVGMLFLALVASSISVGAAPASIFTNNGCVVGNYACLQASQPNIFTNNNCAVGNYACLQAALGYPYYGYPGYYNAPYGYPYYPVGYAPYTYAPAPAPAPAPTVTATIVSGRVVTVGQQVSATIDGFTAGETVTASVTAPNGQVMQIGSATAAADGSVTVSLTFSSPGTWTLTVHGGTSNKTVTDSYTVQ
jgi:hypothetical protein